MTEDDLLTKRMHQLAEGIVPPPLDGRGDLRRGRRRLRRNRTGAAVSAAATVAAVAAGAAALHNPGSTVVEPGGGGQTSTVPTATQPEHAEPDEVVPTSTTRRDFPRRYGAPPGAKSAVSEYNDILADHLDPFRRHLERYDGVGFSGGSDEVGAKFSWTTPGQEGEGMLHVAVTLDWSEAQIRLAHGAWRPSDANLPAGWTAEVARYGEGTAVVVHRADGVSVAIDANTLFGNNSATPVNGFEFGVADLVSTASDERFVYPR